MPIIIKRNDLLRSLQFVSGVVERRSTMQILSNVLLAINNARLYVLASDMEVELLSSAALEASSSDKLLTTVSGRILFDICRMLPEDAVITITDCGRTISVDAANSHFDLATLPADDFPRTKEQQKMASFTIPQKVLLSMVKKTSSAVADNHAHIYLNGLLMEISGNMVRAVASDGHRLAMYTLNKSVGEPEFSVIIPKKAIMEIARSLTDADELVTVEIAANFIRVLANEFTLTSKLIDSKYPIYSKLIPAGCDKRIILNAAEFKNAVFRVGVLQTELMRSICFDLSSGLLRLSAQNVELESAKENIIVNYEGDPVDTGFNIAYLLDALASTKTPEITLTFRDGRSGIIIEEVGGTEDSFYLVMPCHV